VPRKKRMTISQLAKLAGVSTTTASLVLNGRAEQYRIAEETQRKILAVAEEHNFQPSHFARALREQRSRTLGLVVPELTNYGFAAVARDLERLCRQAGYQLLIACSEEDGELELEVVDSLLSRQVDGVIVASALKDDKAYQAHSRQCPIIQLDRHIGHSSLPLVITDAAQATAELVAQMAAEAPRELIYLGGILEMSPSRHRLAGYLLGMRRAGREPQDDWIKHRDFRADSAYEMMAETCEQLGRAPEAVFTASFTLLEGVLRYLKEHKLMQSGIRIGTFDDHELLDCMPLPIDAIAQDCRALAQRTFNLMKQLLEGRKPAETALALPARIHWRSRQPGTADQVIS